MFARIKHTIKKTLKYWQYRMLPYRTRLERYLEKHKTLKKFWPVVAAMAGLLLFQLVSTIFLVLSRAILGRVIFGTLVNVFATGFALFCVVGTAWLILDWIREKILDFQAMLRRKRRARAEGGSEMKKGLNNMGKIRWLVLGTLILVMAAVLLTVTSRMDEAWVGVLYDRPWQGEIGDIGSLTSWGAQGDFVKLLERPEGTAVWTISANAKKLDGSNDELKIFIFYENNNGKMVALARANTSQPYGIAQVTCQVKKP